MFPTHTHTIFVIMNSIKSKHFHFNSTFLKLNFPNFRNINKIFIFFLEFVHSIHSKLRNTNTLYITDSYGMATSGNGTVHLYVGVVYEYSVYIHNISSHPRYYVSLYCILSYRRVYHTQHRRLNEKKLFRLPCTTHLLN